MSLSDHYSELEFAFCSAIFPTYWRLLIKYSKKDDKRRNSFGYFNPEKSLQSNLEASGGSQPQCISWKKETKGRKTHKKQGVWYFLCLKLSCPPQDTGSMQVECRVHSPGSVVLERSYSEANGFGVWQCTWMPRCLLLLNMSFWWLLCNSNFWKPQTCYPKILSSTVKAVTENSMEVAQKIKNRSAVWPS